MNYILEGLVYLFNMQQQQNYEDEAIYDDEPIVEEVKPKVVPQKKRKEKEPESSSQEPVPSSESEERLATKVVDSDEEEKKSKKKKPKVHKVLDPEDTKSKVPTVGSGASRIKKTKKARFDVLTQEGRLLVSTATKTYNYKRYVSEDELMSKIKRKMDKIGLKSIDFTRLAVEFPGPYWNAAFLYKKNFTLIDDMLEKAGLNVRSVVENGVVKRRSGRLRK